MLNSNASEVVIEESHPETARSKARQSTRSFKNTNHRKSKICLQNARERLEREKINNDK